MSMLQTRYIDPLITQERRNEMLQMVIDRYRVEGESFRQEFLLWINSRSPAQQQMLLKQEYERLNAFVNS